MNLPFEIIDTSYWQKPMDYKKAIAKGIKIAFGRLGVGPSYVDPYYAVNSESSELLQLPFSPYIVTVPGYSIDNHITNFHRGLGISSFEGYPVVDMELHTDKATGKQYSAKVITDLNLGLLSYLKELYGGAFLYTRATFMDPYTLDSAEWGEFPLIVAHYNMNVPSPTIPKAYARRGKEYYIWQVSADGNGMGKEYGAQSDSIDLSVMNPAKREWLLDLFYKEYNDDDNGYPDDGGYPMPQMSIEEIAAEAAELERQLGVKGVRELPVQITLHYYRNVNVSIPDDDYNIPPPGDDDDIPPSDGGNVEPGVPAKLVSYTNDDGKEITPIVYIQTGWKQEPDTNPNKPDGVPSLEKMKKGNSIWRLPVGTEVRVEPVNTQVDADLGFYKNYGRQWLDHKDVASGVKYFFDKGCIVD